eukprot:GSChrysophyteH1.ASY1.ANO1.2628.1 assembled CDS
MGDKKSEDCIQVVVRCRPFNTKEKNQGCASIIDINVEGRSVQINKPGDESANKSYTFDGAYDDKTEQKGFYEDCCFALVENVLEGFNGTVFAYGQTGCGKSYTMQGPAGAGPDGRGVTPNAFVHIFDAVKASSDIYQEVIKDLLVDPKAAAKNPKGVFVSNLTKRTVKSEVELQKALDDGVDLRTVASTEMNAESSRSHSIFTIVVEMSAVDPDTQKEIIKVGKLNLVDLAGSERQKKTGASGAVLKEGAKINLSLSVLGNVISALADAKPGKHVPYRDSKLTRLLQDSLGGNTKTLMVAAISPADYNWEETSSTLRYANRAKNIQNKPKINEDPKDTMMRELREQVEMLKKMLQEQGGGDGAPGGTVEVIREVVRDSADTEALKAEKEKMAAALEEERRKHEELMSRMLELQTQFTGNATEKSAEQQEAEQRLKERRKKARARKDAKKEQQLELARLAAAAAEEEMEELKMQQQGYEKKLQAARAEVDDIIEEASYQRGQLLESLRDSDKDGRLYEAICLSVMSEREMKRIMEKARYDEEEEYWIVPFSKRKSMDEPAFLRNSGMSNAGVGDMIGGEISPRSAYSNQKMQGVYGNNESLHSSMDSMSSAGGGGLAAVRQSQANMGNSRHGSRRNSKDGIDVSALPGLRGGAVGAVSMGDEYGEVAFQGGSDYAPMNAIDMSKCGVLPGDVNRDNNVAVMPSIKAGGQDEYDYFCGDGADPTANGPGSLLKVKPEKKKLTEEEKALRAKKRAKKKAKAEKLKLMQEQQNQAYSDEAGAGVSAGCTPEWGWANDDAQQAYEDGNDSEPAYSDDEDFEVADAHPPTESKKSKNTKAPNRKKDTGLPSL